MNYFSLQLQRPFFSILITIIIIIIIIIIITFQRPGNTGLMSSGDIVNMKAVSFKSLFKSNKT